MNQELERLNGSLEKLVQERTDEARHHRKTAQEASETKGLFLATMSHELRTPMNAIIGYSEMLLEEVEKGSAANADLERIRGAGKHLLGLINGILDLSRFEEGQLEMLIEDFARRGGERRPHFSQAWNLPDSSATCGIGVPIGTPRICWRDVTKRREASSWQPATSSVPALVLAEGATRVPSPRNTARGISSSGSRSASDTENVSISRNRRKRPVQNPKAIHQGLGTLWNSNSR